MIKRRLNDDVEQATAPRSLDKGGTEGVSEEKTPIFAKKTEKTRVAKGKRNRTSVPPLKN